LGGVWWKKKRKGNKGKKEAQKGEKAPTSIRRTNPNVSPKMGKEETLVS